MFMFLTKNKVDFDKNLHLRNDAVLVFILPSISYPAHKEIVKPYPCEAHYQTENAEERPAFAGSK